MGGIITATTTPLLVALQYIAFPLCFESNTNQMVLMYPGLLTLPSQLICTALFGIKYTLMIATSYFVKNLLKLGDDLFVDD